MEENKKETQALKEAKDRLDAALTLEAGDAVLNELRAMQADGTLFFLFPDLKAGEGLDQRTEYHAYDVLEHNLHTAAAAAPQFELRLAALLHDIAKPFTQRPDGHMYGHDVMGAELCEKALKRLGYPPDTVSLVSELVRYHMYDLKGEAKGKTLKKRFQEWGLPFCRLLCGLREADVYGSGRLPLGEPVETAVRFRRILREIENEGQGG